MGFRPKHQGKEAEEEYPREFTEIEEQNKWQNERCYRIVNNFTISNGGGFTVKERIWNVHQIFYPEPPAASEFEERWFKRNENVGWVIEKNGITYHICNAWVEKEDTADGWRTHWTKYVVPSYRGKLGTLLQFQIAQNLCNHYEVDRLRNHMFVIDMIKYLPPSNTYRPETHTYWYAPAKQVYEWHYKYLSAYPADWDHVWGVPQKGDYEGSIEVYDRKKKKKVREKIEGSFEFELKAPTLQESPRQTEFADLTTFGLST